MMRSMVLAAPMVCRGGQDEMPGFGRGQRRGDRLIVPHLANQDDVGILPQGGAQRPREGGGVLAHLPLMDQRPAVPVDIFDRVFDRQDMDSSVFIDVTEHRREGGGFAAPGRPRSPE